MNSLGYIKAFERFLSFLCDINHQVFLQRLGEPIQDRHREQEDRPRAFEELGKKLQLYRKFVDSYKQKVNYSFSRDTLSCNKKINV